MRVPATPAKNGLMGPPAVAIAIVCAAVLRAPDAHGQAQGAETDPNALEVHGFVSQGFIKTTQNNYLMASERGSLEFTEAGINFSKGLSDDLRVGLQIFGHELGPIGNYAPRLDWFNLDWRPASWLGIRAGRTKIPFGLYNDSADIDAARVPILLPQSVYPIDHREYLLAQTGGEVYGNVRLGALGTLEYRAYAGTLAVGPPDTAPPGISVSAVENPYVYGGRVLWLPPLQGLTLGGSHQALRLDWNYDIDPVLVPILQGAMLLPANFSGRLPVEFRLDFWIASAEYQAGDLLLSAEYSRWIGDFKSDAPKLLAPHTVNERYYAMLSYRVTPWFTPGIYYSAYYPNVDQREGRAAYQHDVALSFRYDLQEHWLLKVEGHWMEGTAALEPALNGDIERKDLVEEWGALLVKTTAYF